MRLSKLSAVSPIKLLTVDALDTLIRLRRTVGVEYTEVARSFGISCDPNEMSKNFIQSFAVLEKQKPCYGYGQSGSLAWWCEIVSDSSLLQQLSKKIYYHFVTLDPWELVDKKIADVLQDLRQAGIHIAIVSNFDSRLRLIIDAFGLSKYIDAYFLSGELGIEKPNREIFYLAAKHFNIFDMQNVVHFGDSVKKDYLGGKEAGAHSFLMHSPTAASVPEARELVNISENEMVSSFDELLERLASINYYKHS